VRDVGAAAPRELAEFAQQRPARITASSWVQRCCANSATLHTQALVNALICVWFYAHAEREEREVGAAAPRELSRSMRRL
jgi:hypothetical protein